MSSARLAEGYFLRPGSENDRRRATELLARLIGDGRIVRWTDEFWRWKHLHSPFGPSYLGCACREQSGDIVSVEHCMPWRLMTPAGEIVTVGRGCDGSTDAAHQRRGLYLSIDTAMQQEHARRSVPFLFGTPNALTLAMQRKTGWRDAFAAALLLRPVISFRGVRAILKGSEGSGRDRLESWVDFSARRDAEVWHVIQRHERNRSRVGYRTPRDAAFLEWRYHRVPVGHYVVYEMAESGRLHGFVIGRVGAGVRNLPTFVVTDIFHRDPTLLSLVRLLLSLFHRIPAAYALAHFAPGTLERKAWHACGGLRLLGRSVIVNARSLGAAPLDPNDRGSWDFTLSELELF